AAIGQLHVELVLAAAVGVTFDANLHDRVLDEDRGDLVEQGFTAAQDLGLAGGEVDGLVEFDLVLGQHDELSLFGAAVFVLVAVVIFSGVVGAGVGVLRGGALIGHVGDLVLVVVDVGAAVFV